MTSKNASAACSPTSESPRAGDHSALMNHSATPSVLFVCVKNSGKSQMAAGLMRKIAGDSVHVYSAGTKPGRRHQRTLRRVARRSRSRHQRRDAQAHRPQLVRDVDVVVTLGREAHVEPLAGTRFENWDTDEPSERGIDGIERMRLVRDDIAARVADF